VRLTTGLTTGWMYVYTIQPVVKPVGQPVVSCKRGFRVKEVDPLNLRLSTVD